MLQFSMYKAYVLCLCNHWGRPFNMWKMFSADPSYIENCFQPILRHGFPLTQHTFLLTKHAFPLMNIYFKKAWSRKEVFVHEMVTITMSCFTIVSLHSTVKPLNFIENCNFSIQPIKPKQYVFT